MLTKTQLMNVMKYQLISFNNEEVSIDDNTIHSKVLSSKEFGGVSEASLYRQFVMYSLNRAGHKMNPWPANWLDLTVDSLSTTLL